MSLRVKGSNLLLFDEIAAHLLGARNDTLSKGFRLLNRDLGHFYSLTYPSFLGIFDSSQSKFLRPFRDFARNPPMAGLRGGRSLNVGQPFRVASSVPPEAGLKPCPT